MSGRCLWRGLGGAIVLGLLWWAGWSAADAPKLKLQGSELCYSCHPDLVNDFDKAFVHEPIQQDQCISCHNPHTAKFPSMLNDKPPTLCYACHDEMQEEMTEAESVHTAVKEGQCTGCHSPHAADNETLRKATGKELCYSCHENERIRFETNAAAVHAPVEEGKCLVCHDAHGSPYPSQLREGGEDLCFQCHEETDDAFQLAHNQYPVENSDCLSCHDPHATTTRSPELPKGLTPPYVHVPFGKKMCDSCHMSSDASSPFRLIASQKEVCFRCHSDVKARVTERDRVHVPVEQGQCTSCHSPHAARNEKLLVATGRALCANCHPNIMDKLASSYVHSPTAQGQCSRCHDPHSSDEEALLVTDSLGVCESCHETQGSFTHPVGEGVIDPRNQQIVTCVSCHDPHGSEYEYVLLSRRDRDLCIQCHIVR